MFVVKSVTPTVGTDAYEALDCVGGAMEFNFSSYEANAYRPIDLQYIQIIDKAKQSEKFNVHVFSQDVSAAAKTDGDTFDPAADDLAHLLYSKYVADTAYEVAGYANIAHVDCGVKVIAAYDLIVVLEAVETPDYAAADDLIIRLGLEV